MRSARRMTVSIGLLLGAVALLAGRASSCVPTALLTVTPAQAKAGQEVTVQGQEFATGIPIVLRWDALDGPVLATVPGPQSDLPRKWSTTLTLPETAPPGTYVLVATQPSTAGRANTSFGVPARASVHIIGESSPVAASSHEPPATRPADLEREKGAPVGLLLLVALGAAGLALLPAGLAALMTNRRIPELQSQEIRSR